MNFLAKGYLIADVVTIIGTLDIVFGECEEKEKWWYFLYKVDIILTELYTIVGELKELHR